MFGDRTEAGKALARELEALIEAAPELSDPVVLALPRGGAPIGLEVARVLGAPLDLLLVRKIGAPLQPEYAVAAVVNGDAPDVVVNEDALRAVRMSDADFEAAKRRALDEIERRRALYLSGRKRAPVEGRTVIVVDDGVATGATARAGLKAVRRRGPKALILAVPVAPLDFAKDVRAEVDRFVCLQMPSPFIAVGAHYARFDQVEDSEVTRLLDMAAAAIGEGAGPSDAE